MDDLFQPFAERFDEVLTKIIADKSEVFDVENGLPLILTAQQCQKMLGIGTHAEFQRITHLPDFPKIDKGRGSHIRYPRDAVRAWVNTHWQDIA